MTHTYFSYIFDLDVFYQSKSISQEKNYHQAFIIHMTRMLIGRVSVPAFPMFPIPAMFAFEAWILALDADDVFVSQ